MLRQIVDGSPLQTGTMKVLKSWLLCTGCGLHDIHNGFTWGISKLVQINDMLDDLYMALESLRNGYRHVKRVQDAQDVRSCSDELRSLCSSSAVGQRVHGHALALLCQREYLNDLDQIINDALCDEITMEKLNLAYCKAQTSADKWEYDLRCKSKSTVTADYLGVEIVLNVVDATSVAHGKICCHIKWLGVKSPSTQS